MHSSLPCPSWPLYRTTVLAFESEPPWPAFAILTGQNRMGVADSPEANAVNDARMRAALVASGTAPIRVYGCSPDLVHREASWAVPLTLPEAVALGSSFRQDAVFHVADGVVALVSCPPRPPASESLGPLSARTVDLRWLRLPSGPGAP